MKISLFWKIAISFWVTLFVIGAGTWLLVVLVDPEARGGGAGMRSRYLAAAVVAPSLVLRTGGKPALDELVRSWDPDDRRRLTVTDAGVAAPAPVVVSRADPGRVWQATTTVVGPDHSWRVTYRALRTPKLIPQYILWSIAIACSLASSAVLAWHLTRPIQRLRAGFDRLARGDLSVRLRPAMGGRRDEIADLGRDFDLMAERLQQLVGARDQLLHDVSHELRSPLARLQTAIGLARQRPVRADDAMTRIELESRRLDELVGELLTLSRAESAAPLHHQYLDVVELARTVATDAKFEAAPRDVRVDFRVGSPAGWDDSDATVKGSAELLRRGLENVVRNALRHSAAGQTVVIEVRPEPDKGTIVIEVADEGPGAPPDGLGVMFEPFVRLNGGPRADGFGLGLAIARRAIQAHGGEIGAVNREGGGLMVVIRLPLNNGDGETRRPGAVATS